MNNIVKLPIAELKEYRSKCCFKNSAVQVKGEDGEIHKYPCIVLYEKETNIPILYTGLERYICNLVDSSLLKNNTLAVRGYAICHCLNYILYETNINSLHECSINTIREILKFIKTKEDGSEYKKDTWSKYRNYILEFFCMYYKHNKDKLPFQYNGEELEKQSIFDVYQNKSRLYVNTFFHLSPPKTTQRKNRILVDGYLDLLLDTAKKYDPEIVLGIALAAYAGLRVGEVVNVSCGRIKIIRKYFAKISKIEIDITDTAPYFKNWNKKTNPGSIKKYRIQRVYNSFVSKISDMYEYHLALLESKGFDTAKDAPLFVNKQGKPMSVQTYSDRLKKLFYERFIPTLKKTCEREGTYADNAAFIEAYENEYPGAHMLRHWFTMYLLTKAKLQSGEIMKWRGDSSQESMNDYIHENGELIEIFKESSYVFQAQILEDIYSC